MLPILKRKILNFTPLIPFETIIFDNEKFSQIPVKHIFQPLIAARYQQGSYQLSVLIVSAAHRDILIIGSIDYFGGSVILLFANTKKL